MKKTDKLMKSQLAKDILHYHNYEIAIKSKESEALVLTTKHFMDWIEKQARADERRKCEEEQTNKLVKPIIDMFPMIAIATATSQINAPKRRKNAVIKLMANITEEAYAKGKADEQKRIGDKNEANFACGMTEGLRIGRKEGRKEGISAVEKELAKEGLERKQLNLVDGYIPVDDLIERIEEALAAARKKASESLDACERVSPQEDVGSKPQGGISHGKEAMNSVRGSDISHAATSKPEKPCDCDWDYTNPLCRNHDPPKDQWSLGKAWQKGKKSKK